ncbi:hypothetical protein Tco_0767919 [Tanacetum coccineum]
MSKVLHERGSGSLPSLIKTNPKDHVKSNSTIEEVDTPLIRHEKEVLMKLKKLQVDPTEFAKSLRRLLKENSRIEEEVKATMHEHCSTTLNDDLPHNEKDPGSFTIPYKINDMCFDKFLADLGASLSVMPYSTFTNLGLDMPEDIKISLILRRPFLSTAHAKIDLNKHDMEDLDPTIKEGEIVDEPRVYIVKARVAYVKEIRFDGFITISDGNDSVTYRMAISHPRFKHLSNAQCNKIRPLLKVSAHDKLEGNSHPYQMLKGFYKGILKLGPEYTKDEKMVEWLIKGHVSMHEMD